MTMEYHGARFFKCDLQMQTPADKHHWIGESFDLSEDPAGAATTYIQRCYDVGLEVIAITDHNFSSKSFIPHLKKAAKDLAKNYELIIFPGFEFTANVGTGVHVLGLFEPNTDLERIDHILTECGVPNPRQSENGAHKQSKLSLDEIIETIQFRNENSGVVLLPHIQSNSGIFDNDKVSEWLQASEFQNPDLLAVEIPKSVSKMSENFQTLFLNGQKCNAEWKRVRPIATLMSSDCKAIEDSSKSGNLIGSRYSWVRMSEPSIEALRQAFLDPSSRIRICDDAKNCPDKSHTHPYISSIKVSGAGFLADQSIRFSPHLNAIIGGRGTGKSTVIEYLRIALAQSDAVPASLRDDFDSLRSTIVPKGNIEVAYCKGSGFEGKEWHLRSQEGEPPGLVQDEDVGSFNSFFPVKIFSRGQIEAIANDPVRQRFILDDLNQNKLNKLNGDETELVSELKQMNVSLGRLPDLGEEKANLTAEIKTLGGVISKVEEKAGTLGAWSNRLKEITAFEDYSENFTTFLQDLDEIADDLPMELLEHKISEDDAGFVDEYRQNIEALSEKLKTDLKTLKENYAKEAMALSANSKFEKWNIENAKAESEHQNALVALEDQGVDPDLHKENLRDLEIAKTRLSEVNRQLEELENTRKEIRDIVSGKLNAIWEEQFNVREDSANTLNTAVPMTENGKPTVQSNVTKFGEMSSF